jgi:hypothetical protein
MNRVPFDSSMSEIESMLAVERVLLPEPDDMRQRVIERARASLPDNVPAFAERSPNSRQVRIGVVAAVAIVLPALCAAAFFAGYGIRNRSADAVAQSPAAPPSVPSIVVQQVPAASVVVALIPVAPPPGQLSTNSEVVLGVRRAGNPSPSGAAKSAIDIESYTKELRVLQPAREAVARQDFNSALSAIAEHQRMFPSGRLTEEREALRVKALLGVGRTAEAQRAGAAFRARFPRSALLGRIEEMLGRQK